MDLTKVISTTLDTLNRRVVKILRMGKSDVRTAISSAPFGVDSNPTKDMIAIYSETSRNGNPIIVGYINKNQLANVGESRIFSTDENGTVKFYVWLKNNGTIEIGGNSDNAIRFGSLNTALQSYLTNLNAAISAGIVGAGGAYTPPTALDISSAKINEIKTL